ncbi:hypothetical protein BXY53_0188 [Dichotomicrobium thermohalophilum]|uniref:Uncharacterized protein n=1 Tax=Dichotomicrobium thermohalophilum TaxID=933063 RepID=A0A397Q5Q3_9HYPH|nr:hypothetical protein BXY53_0188 [Dichotomicrobium thermohalophilum]
MADEAGLTFPSLRRYDPDQVQRVAGWHQSGLSLLPQAPLGTKDGSTKSAVRATPKIRVRRRRLLGDRSHGKDATQGRGENATPYTRPPRNQPAVGASEVKNGIVRSEAGLPSMPGQFD